MSTTMTPQPAAPAPPQKLNADGTVKKPWYKQDFYVGRAVKIDELMTFSRQLSSFLRAGVPADGLGVVRLNRRFPVVVRCLGHRVPRDQRHVEHQQPQAPRNVGAVGNDHPVHG